MASPTSCSLTTLHQLSWLCLNGPSIKCVDLLNHVHLPKRPVLWLGFEVGSWSANPPHWIISATTRHCGVHDDETALRGLSIETIFGGCLRVQAKDVLQNTQSENPAAGLLPALHTLICRHASFGQESTKMTHMGRLLAILDHRRGLGSGIKSLHLCECHGFTEQDMALLKVIVPTVICVDGHGGGGYQCLRCSRG